MVAQIDDLETWQTFYNKQDKLEKLRLYFCIVAWELLEKVFPNHRIHDLYVKATTDPCYIQHRLEAEGGLLELNLSMSSMGQVPTYNVLGLNTGHLLNPDIKIERVDD